MSLRTFKSRPRPNLDLTNKRRPLTDQKINEEIEKKTTECSSGNSETVGSSSSLTEVSVTEKIGNDNEIKLSSSSNEAVTASSIGTKTSSGCTSLAKLKPRPRPNLALGSRVNNATQKSTTNNQPDAEDCVIVGVSYTNGDVTQENKVTSSSAAAVPGDAVKLSSLDTQRNITAKLKARPKPNLISFNRCKRPFAPESTTPLAAQAPSNNNSSENVVKEIQDVINCTKTDDSKPSVTLSSDELGIKTCTKLKNIPVIEDKPTDNINSLLPKQENERILKKKPPKNRIRKRKKQVKLNTRLLALRAKLRCLVRALELLEKIIAKKKKQINFQNARSENLKVKTGNGSRKNVLIKKKIKIMMKIIKMIKEKLKKSALRIKMKDGLLYSKLLRVVLKEINKAKKNVAKLKRTDDKNKTFLEKQKQTTGQTGNSNIAEDKPTEKSLPLQSNNDNIDSTMKKDESITVSPQKKDKVQKIRWKINPMITKPSGVKSMRIKIFKDDGSCVKSELTSSSDKCDKVKDSVTTSQSTKQSSSPSKDIKSATGHSRRFNMSTVKPNLATANRNYKPIQYTTSYGKLNNAVKQKFKDKFGSKKPPEHSKLTMLDLIFYNPSTNPMSEKEKKKDLLTESEISNEDSKQSIKSEEKSVNENNVPPREEASAEEPDESSTAVDTIGLPVPQLKITADGKVIIAPESLIVPGKNDEAIKNESRPLIVENDLTHHKVFNKKSKLEKKVWTFQETLKFYKVLNETGSDFLSMASHFPDRTRNCLKRKFKREEKINGELIDKVIGSRRIDFSHVEKELALNQMWDEVEKSCKRRSKYIPDIPDVNKGSISDMFLTKKEREMKATNGGDDSAVNDDTSSKPGKQEGVRKTASKKKRKPKVLRLKEYLSENGSNGASNGNAKKTFQINLKCLEEPESTNVSSDEEELVKENTDIPIVVNTRIESSGIKYTKSVTFNPGNMDLPVDINETIAHTSTDQECPSSTEIIKEIVDILSTDERPSILSTEDETHSTEDVCESDQSIITESGNVCNEES